MIKSESRHASKCIFTLQLYESKIIETGKKKNYPKSSGPRQNTRRRRKIQAQKQPTVMLKDDKAFWYKIRIRSHPVVILIQNKDEEIDILRPRCRMDDS